MKCDEGDPTVESVDSIEMEQFNTEQPFTSRIMIGSVKSYEIERTSNGLATSELELGRR